MTTRRSLKAFAIRSVRFLPMAPQLIRDGLTAWVYSIFVLHEPLRADLCFSWKLLYVGCRLG
ncbi:unnamed protein product [Symbiodinium natans]|uniref:Uncharacterized protein n=1 Tax=Symbiodinium natans TaxID=878477 RepID=A0A812RE32_9DINO|nr:unnamed protein product [Symbiodinium natans]